MSKVIIEKDFIKIPRDFKSIHNLEELIIYTDHFQKLSNSLLQYKTKYVESFLKSGEEVLKIIPNNHHSKYKVQHYNTSILSNKELFPDPSRAKRDKLWEALSDDEKSGMTFNRNNRDYLWM